VIALRLCTDRPSGTVIDHWDFEPPWPDHDMVWDFEPEDIIPKEHQDEYKKLFKSRLMKVLNGGYLIGRGHPVEGLLCGASFQPIAESCHGVISAKLSFTDDLENTVPLCIDLNVVTLSHASAKRLPVGRAAYRSTDRGRASPGADAIGVGSALETSKSEWGGRAIPTGPGSESGSLRGDAATRQSS
jgi:hypothetical protein